MSGKTDVMYPIKGREDITCLPDGFPVYDNHETLAMMQPVYNHLFCTEKIFTCSAINALTINLRLPSKSHAYNSNFIAMEAGSGKTTFLEGIFEGNPDYTVKTKSKHFESEMYQKNVKDFMGKTWINYDCIPTFLSSSKKQLSQLIDFYSGLLSDGVFGRGEFEIHADFNIQYAMAIDSFSTLQKIFKDRTFFERVVPIFCFITHDERKRIDIQTDINKENDFHLHLKLPYLDNIDNNDEKIRYKIPSVFRDWKAIIMNKLCCMNGNSRNRNSQYINNFLASNALINGRVQIIDGKKYVVPIEADLKMFEWIIDVHNRFPAGSLEGIVYEETIDYGFPVTVPILMMMPRIQEVMLSNSFLEVDMMNALQRCLDDLLLKGLLVKVQTKGVPTFDLANRSMIVE